MGFKICGKIFCLLICVLLVIPSVVGFGGIYSSDQCSDVLEKPNTKEKGELLDSDMDVSNSFIRGIAGAFAGLAGALMAPIHAVTPYMGHAVILTAFIVVIVGGMASIEGAVLAAVLFGFIHTFVTTLFDAVVASMVGVGVMVIVLVAKPSGLLGRVKA